MLQEKTVPRSLYEDALGRHLGTPEIKVLTGVRRCGKSTLLKSVACRIQDEGFPSENIFFRRFDEFGMPVNPDANWLLSQIEDALQKANPSFPFRVFLDEVQEVSGWEKVVRQLYTRPNTEVFITGSNAYILSSELATFLAGRYVEIPVYPLGFTEYLEFARAFGRDCSSLDEVFSRFLTFGGMPGLFHLADDCPSIEESLSSVFDAVILNDVARRSTVTDLDLLTKLVRYVFSTSGSLFSTKGIADALTSAGRKTKPDTIDSYLYALVQAFALCGCEQAGLAGKAILRPLLKWYPVDTGLRNLSTGFSGQDLGYQLENVVYMELRRRGYRVFVGTLPKGEVDFVAERRSERAYFQVTTSVLDEGVYARELSPLERIGDSFPKTVLTLDGWKSGVTATGIRLQKLTDWLLGA